MMDADYSKSAVFAYLDNVTRQGFLNANTASGLRAAASKLMEDVADSDDVRKVDVDALALRYHNKHPGELSTESLNVYRRRLARLISEFSEYVTNPLNFKPRSRTVAKSNARAGAGKKEEKPEVTVTSNAGNLNPTSSASVATVTATATKTTLMLPYPLREDFVAQVVIPINITSDEARRLCAFITTLATDFKPRGDV